MMQVPTLFDWIQRFEFLRGMPAAYLALVAALMVAVVWDWRVSVLALATQYFATSILYLDVLEPRFVIIKLFVGWFVCIMLYFTARQMNWTGSDAGESRQEDARPSLWRRIFAGLGLLSADLAYRLFLALFVALAAVILSERQGLSLPAVTQPINLAVFALGGLGLVGLATKSEPFMAGAGLLTFMNGFELFYNTLEQSIGTLIFLAAANLILALTISYLAQSRNVAARILRQGGPS